MGEQERIEIGMVVVTSAYADWMTQDIQYRLCNGNAFDVLKTFPSESVDCCVTSPPYFGLRDYGTATWVGGDPNCPHFRQSKFNADCSTGHKAQGDSSSAVGDSIYKSVCPLCGAVRVDEQIGLEETPEEYVSRLVEVFHEVKRVLKNDGTLWLNLGDSYWSSAEGKSEIYKSKDLIGIPWMVAFALRNDGWYLRQDIVWSKPNSMPESVKDRCTRSHEYIFLLSKSEKYRFDYESIMEDATTEPTVRDKHAEGYQADYAKGQRFSPGAREYGKDGKRNKRDVWTVPVSGGFTDEKGAHYATFSEKLIKPCITAGCRAGGIVLDPFSGTGTTGVTALKLGRRYVGIDLNEKYIDMSHKRLKSIADQENMFELMLSAD